MYVAQRQDIILVPMGKRDWKEKRKRQRERERKEERKRERSEEVVSSCSPPLPPAPHWLTAQCMLHARGTTLRGAAWGQLWEPDPFPFFLLQTKYLGLFLNESGHFQRPSECQSEIPWNTAEGLMAPGIWHPPACCRHQCMGHLAGFPGPPSKSLECFRKKK